jgi:hypothetical protein
MQKYVVKILDTAFLAHDFRYFRVEKPPGFSFIPGQTIDAAINRPGWMVRKKPFSMLRMLLKDLYNLSVPETNINKEEF